TPWPAGVRPDRVCISEDGSCLVWSTPEEADVIHVWDVKRARRSATLPTAPGMALLPPLRSRDGRLLASLFSPDTVLVASSHGSGGQLSTYVHDLSTGRVLACTRGVAPVAWDVTGRYLVTQGRPVTGDPLPGFTTWEWPPGSGKVFMLHEQCVQMWEVEQP